MNGSAGSQQSRQRGPRLVLIDLFAEPTRRFAWESISTGCTQRSRTHQLNGDTADQRLERGRQRLIACGFWRDEQDRVVGQDGVLGIVEHSEFAAWHARAAGEG